MNLSRTLLVFGLLLAMLWLFGLMVAYKKTVGDDSQVMPTLQAADAKIDSITIKHAGKKAPPDVLLVRDGDTWYLQQKDQRVKLDRFRVDQLVGAIKRARLDDNYRPRDDLATYDLTNPRLTYILKGKLHDAEHTWTFQVGKETADGQAVFVSSSDRPSKAYAVDKKGIDEAVVNDLATLRPKRLFEFDDAAVNRVDLQRGDTEVELKRGADGTWRFEKPALGFAGFESTAPPPPPGGHGAEPAGGVKGLLGALRELRVDSDDDFVPPGGSLASYGLQAGKEAMRFEIASMTTGFEKKESQEALLVGKQVPGESAYYARLRDDDGVFKLRAKQLQPLEAALDDPGKIRSKDIAAFDVGKVDQITLQQGALEATLTRPTAGGEWKVQAGKEAVRKANEKAVQALLDAVQGKGAIQAFEDLSPGMAAKFDADKGLDAPGAVVAVYVAALERKDKEKEATPKKDAKAVVTLALGKVEKDTVYAKRTLPDGTVSRFTAGKALVERLEPSEGIDLAYLDPQLPGPATGAITEVTLQRGGDRLEFVRKLEEEAGGHWYIKDPQEPKGVRPADMAKVNQLVDILTNLQAKKWVARVDAKTDLEAYGLKTPSLVVTLAAKKEGLPATGVASLVAIVSPAAALNVWTATGAAVAQQAADPGDTLKLQFGKEDKDKNGVYGLASGTDIVFLADAEVVKLAREADFRDRTLVLNLQAVFDAGQVASILGGGPGAIMLASPLGTRQVVALDPAKVKDLRLTIRTPDELRSLSFRRADKTWQDQSGLQEFQLDPERVTSLLERLAHLQATRFVAFAGGPRAEHKLTAKEATARFDFTLDDGRTFSLLVGTEFERHGYFASTSAWPGVVFLIPGRLVDPLVAHPVGSFAKERVAAGQ